MPARKRFQGFTAMSQKRYPRIIVDVLDLVADQLCQQRSLQIAVAGSDGDLVEIWDCRLIGTEEIQALCFPVESPLMGEEYQGCTIEASVTEESATSEPVSEGQDWYMTLLGEVDRVALPLLDFSLFSKKESGTEEGEPDQGSPMPPVGEVVLVCTEEREPDQTAATSLMSESSEAVEVVSSVHTQGREPSESDLAAALKLETFRREVFRVWRSLAIATNKQNYWCVPVSLEAIYRQSFSNMLARSFFLDLVRLEGVEAGGCRILLIDSDGSGYDIGGGRRVEALTFTPVGLKSASEPGEPGPVDSSVPSIPSVVATPAVQPIRSVQKRGLSGAGAIANGLHSLQSWLPHPKPPQRNATDSNG